VALHRGHPDWDPIWARARHQDLARPSSLWFDARGQRFPAPHFPGFDTLGTLGAIRATGFDYSWFVLTQKIIEKEFALSGSEQNPDLTARTSKLTLSRVRPAPPPRWRRSSGTGPTSWSPGRWPSSLRA